MRNYDDIPEPFRRALENMSEEGNGGDGPPATAPSRGPLRPWWRNRWFWIGLAALLILLSFNSAITAYTDWLWFQGLNFDDVWLTQWLYRVVSGLIFFLIAAVVLLLNWHIARRRTLRLGNRVSRQLLSLPGLGWLISAAGLFLAFIFSQAGGAQWSSFLRFLYRVPYGASDPIFGQDISFYLFELPVYNFIHGWLLFLLILVVPGIFLIYSSGSLQIATTGRVQRIGPVPGLRPHLAIIGALIFLFWALSHWLDIYQLMYSRSGVVVGPGYTDIQAQLLALQTQGIAMVLLAAATVFNAFRPNWRLPAIAGGIWLLAAIGLGNIYPAVLQRYVVEPNELELEREFIAHNLEFTRMAFDLDDVDRRPFSVGADLTQADIINEVSLQNVRVWDYRPLQQTYTQLQGLRPYYQFNEIDIDRYVINGQTRQVMLAARELKKAELPSRTWQNEKLYYTHGYGVVMNPVDTVTRDGQPTFFIQNLPPESSIDLEVTEPGIYYGELDGDVVFVNSNTQELDYPLGETNVNTSYDGSGGIPLLNFMRRLLFAVRFSETNLLLSQEVTPETRVMFHRRITDRVNQITPFITLDSDPYIVIADGRLFWMLDGYTLSNDFPYATPTANNRLNYIRNSVKITVDAYNGTVNYYLADTEDPIIRAYARAFPGLFQDLNDMPPALLAHVRYPEDLFRIQTQQYLTYHMRDVQVYYNREDVWQIPLETLDTAQQPMEPYYVVLTLPGEDEPEYLLIQPYTPAGKDNMIAWIAARNDVPYFGQLVVYELPKQELVFGPSQIEARIDQDTAISQQISLWDQQGSRVIRGNLIVIPINENFLYVEPLYLLSESSALPELKRVIVATGDRIVMRENLTDALAGLLLDEGEIVVDETDQGETETGTETTAPLDATFESLVNEAQAHFDAAETAQRNGDWATYGEELAALEDTLAQLLALTEGAE